MSGMILPTNHVAKPNFFLLFIAPLLGVLDGGNPFISIRIFLFVPFLLASKLLRIIWLCVLH